MLEGVEHPCAGKGSTRHSLLGLNLFMPPHKRYE